MSWSTISMSYQDLKKYLLKSYGNYIVVDHKTTNFCKHLWVSLKDTTTNETFIVLHKISRGKDETWNYNSIPENHGPCEIDCPLDLIQSTSGLNSEFGTEWRIKVVKYHERLKKLKNLSIGTKVSVYGKDLVIVGKQKKTWLGKCIESGTTYKLPRKAISIRME